jgi:ribonucleotide monophosphatase NagD (HAD superfamily)
VRGAGVPPARTLAIGDSVRTDLKGAAQAGVDCLFVTAGIHAGELGHRHDPDLGALAELFAAAGVAPIAVMRRLVW